MPLSAGCRSRRISDSRIDACRTAKPFCIYALSVMKEAVSNLVFVSLIPYNVSSPQRQEMPSNILPPLIPRLPILHSLNEVLWKPCRRSLIHAHILKPQNIVAVL